MSNWRKNRSLNKHWGLFMANTSHSTHPRYLILFGCGHGHVIAGYCGFLSLFFLSYSLPHFILTPLPFLSVFRQHPFLCVYPDQRSVYNCPLVLQKECLKQTGLLKWPIVCWPQKVRRWWRGEERGGVEKQGLMERWANRTEEEGKEREMTSDEGKLC